jgi:hypothetical protein
MMKNRSNQEPDRGNRSEIWKIKALSHQCHGYHINTIPTQPFCTNPVQSSRKREQTQRKKRRRLLEDTIRQDPTNGRRGRDNKGSEAKHDEDDENGKRCLE